VKSERNGLTLRRFHFLTLRTAIPTPTQQVCHFLWQGFLSDEGTFGNFP
jgi:hypothetical protein